MTEYLRFLRGQLGALGVKEADVNAIEKHTVEVWGGSQIYIARWQTTVERDQIKRLIASGVAPRTARKKVRGR